jgi:hypothetical protein
MPWRLWIGASDEVPPDFTMRRTSASPVDVPSVLRHVHGDRAAHYFIRKLQTNHIDGQQATAARCGLGPGSLQPHSIETDIARQRSRSPSPFNTPYRKQAQVRPAPAYRQESPEPEFPSVFLPRSRLTLTGRQLAFCEVTGLRRDPGKAADTDREAYQTGVHVKCRRPAYALVRGPFLLVAGAGFEPA